MLSMNHSKLSEAYGGEASVPLIRSLSHLDCHSLAKQSGPGDLAAHLILDQKRPCLIQVKLGGLLFSKH